LSPFLVGGAKIEAATLATISLTGWENYLKPISIPLTISIKINKFSARLRLLIKPFWESSRIWVGLHRDSLNLSVEVEPIISNKMIRLGVVNAIVERRIKAALDEFLILPKMDDIGFWPFDGRGGFFWDEDDESEDEETAGDEGEKMNSTAESETSPTLKHSNVSSQQNLYSSDIMDDDSISKDQGGKTIDASPENVKISSVSTSRKVSFSAIGSEPPKDLKHSSALISYLETDSLLMSEARRVLESEAVWLEKTEIIRSPPRLSRAPSHDDGAGGNSWGEEDDPMTPETYIGLKSKDSSRKITAASSLFSSTVAKDSENDTFSLTAFPELVTDTSAPSSDNVASSVCDSLHELSKTDAENPNPDIASPVSASMSTVSNASTSKTSTMAVLELLGETAEFAGKKSREYKLDEYAKKLSTTAEEVSLSLKSKTLELSESTLAYFGYAPIPKIQALTQVHSLNEGAPSDTQSTMNSSIIQEDSAVNESKSSLELTSSHNESKYWDQQNDLQSGSSSDSIPMLNELSQRALSRTASQTPPRSLKNGTTIHGSLRGASSEESRNLQRKNLNSSSEDLYDLSGSSEFTVRRSPTKPSSKRKSFFEILVIV
jgi:hypothetical protein